MTVNYGRRWRKLRDAVLATHPLCSFCSRFGLTVAAEVVDHIDPHRGDPAKFWDRGNLQTLCSSCHNSQKQRMEKGGPMLGCDVSGWPVDPNHAWNKGAH